MLGKRHASLITAAEPQEENVQGDGNESTQDCRVCFADDSSPTNPMLQGICKCSGTSSYIHLECLESWRETLRTQGLWKRANHCEICHAPWKRRLIQHAQRKAGHSPWMQPGVFLSRCSRQLLQLVNNPSWFVFLFRMWRSYIFSAGAVNALLSGIQGLKAGVKVGRSLVEEQSGVLIYLMAALADLLGTPVTEMVWIQVVAGVAFALATEFVYSAVIGCVGGAVLGFCTGYVGAIRGTLKFVVGGASKLLRLGARRLRNVL